MSLLQVKNLSFSYQTQRLIFGGVNFALAKGEILSILGPNGAGKSTLLNCLANLLKPSAGEILLEGRPISSLKPKEVARSIGYVPQNHNPAYAFTVKDFAVMGRAPYLSAFARPSAADYELTDQVLTELRISHLAAKPYTEISGGERQMATIARVLVQQPAIILMDEPTAHLDYGNQLRTLRMVRELAKRGYTVIITTHQPDQVLMLGGYAGILGPDGILEFGKAKEILQEETLTRIYNTPIKLVQVAETARKLCVPVEI